jgi:hypothetical protein
VEAVWGGRLLLNDGDGSGRSIVGTASLDFDSRGDCNSRESVLLCPVDEEGS